MELIINGHDYKYETEKVVRLFYPNEKIIFSYNSQASSKRYILTEVKGDTVFVEVYLDSESFVKKCVFGESIDKEELVIARVVFDILSAITGKRPSWGIMTGIRPAKLYRTLKSMGDEYSAESVLKREYLISDKKFSLCRSVSQTEEKIISLSDKKSFSLYVSIPFCPSRCKYCSFVSHSIEKTARLIPEYLEKLEQELILTAEIANDLGLKLETVYIGGGTPTVLNAEQMDSLLHCIAKNFDVKGAKEFTVEAGRPDTINKEILEVLRKYNVDRISINPQTFCDETLKRIGRKHTTSQTVDAFLLAREAGFDNINMDLIAGLEGETVDEFLCSVKKTLQLDPESVTIHTLSLKTASYLAEEGSIEKSNNTSVMLDDAYNMLSANSYLPYYMYRQSKTLDNLENTGWSKEDKECLYNVFMMDETHTVLAVGGGAVTKLKQPDGEFIDRIFNFKFPYEYIGRFEEIIERKKGILEFYNRYNFNGGTK